MCVRGERRNLICGEDVVFSFVLPLIVCACLLADSFVGVYRIRKLSRAGIQAQGGRDQALASRYGCDVWLRRAGGLHRLNVSALESWLPQLDAEKSSSITAIAAREPNGHAFASERERGV